MKVAEFGFNLRADGERQVTVRRWGYCLLVFDRSLHIAHARRLSLYLSSARRTTRAHARTGVSRYTLRRLLLRRRDRRPHLYVLELLHLLVGRLQLPLELHLARVCCRLATRRPQAARQRPAQIKADRSSVGIVVPLNALPPRRTAYRRRSPLRPLLHLLEQQLPLLSQPL